MYPGVVRMDRKQRWREAHPEQQREIKRAIKARIRGYVAGRRALARCAFCGSSDHIQWHHPEEDGTSKNRLAHAARDQWSQERIDAEIARCVPLCQKHHSREHALSRRAQGFQTTVNRPIREARLLHGAGYDNRSNSSSPPDEVHAA